jgi:hypothetical protein
MHVAGRMAAALFLAFFAAPWATPGADAAPRAKTGCARASLPGKACLHATRRRMAAPKRAPYRLGLRPVGRIWPQARRHRLYRGNEAAMAQLSPKLRARRAFTLRFDNDDRDGCGQYNGRTRGPRRACVSQIGLPDALLQPPNASTERALRALGIPIIPDVPPIVITHPAPHPRDDLHPFFLEP